MTAVDKTFTARPAPPRIEDIRRIALFLDVDGTLSDIAPVPHLAVVESALIAALRRLYNAMGGAVALVSGREIADVDRMLGHCELDTAGIHGAQIRTSGQIRSTVAADEESLREADRVITQKFAQKTGVFIERKSHSIAVHFRENPAIGGDVAAAVTALSHEGAGLKCIHGKMIAEIMPAGADKGRAIRQLMSVPPYRNRLPVFVGDDVTDEDGFAAVNDLNGVSVKIGRGPSCAAYGFDDPPSFRKWLHEMAARAGQRE